MAKGSLKFEVKGLKDVQDGIDRISEKMEVDLNSLVEAAAYDTNDDAVSIIQRNNAIDLGAGGGLLSHQFVRQESARSWAVGNSAFYAAFIEFGTGRQVQVPAEWEEVASKYKGPYPGTWNLFEQNIKIWMKRHGMDPDQSYPLMMHILRNGLKARPFLYPAFVKNRAELIENVKKLFSKK